MHAGNPPEETNAKTSVYNKTTTKIPEAPWGKNPNIHYLFLMKAWKKQAAAGKYNSILNGKMKHFWTWHYSTRWYYPKKVAFSNQGAIVKNAFTHATHT